MLSLEKIEQSFKKKTGFHPRQAWDKGTFISNHNNIQTHSQQWDK